MLPGPRPCSPPEVFDFDPRVYSPSPTLSFPHKPAHTGVLSPQQESEPEELPAPTLSEVDLPLRLLHENNTPRPFLGVLE